jgi:hypothetical protein
VLPVQGSSASSLGVEPLATFVAAANATAHLRAFCPRVGTCAAVLGDVEQTVARVRKLNHIRTRLRRYLRRRIEIREPPIFDSIVRGNLQIKVHELEEGDVDAPNVELQFAEHREAHVRVDIFGPITVSVGAELIDTGMRTKARELLAFLVLREKGASMDQIIAALWPDIDPIRGQANFRTALGNVRSVTRQQNGKSAVICRNSWFQLDRTIVASDLWDLRKAITSRDADELVRVVDGLTSASVLPTLYSDWAIEAQRALAREIGAGVRLVVAAVGMETAVGRRLLDAFESI